jgi:replicative DNA helicase
MSAAMEALRVPPHSIEAEQAVLGGLMLVTSALVQIRDWLHEDDFYRKDHRLIYRAICELDDRKQPCDAIMLAGWFDDNGLGEMVGGTSYLIELANATPSAANIVAYAEIVGEKSKLRKAIDIGSKLAEDAWARGAQSAEVAALAVDELAQLQQSAQRTGLLPAKAGLKAYWADAMARVEGDNRLLGLPMPWPEANDVIGGLEPATVYVVAGRPNMGKSVWANQVAGFNALAGRNTALFSLEATVKRCMARAVACLGQVPFRFARQPDSDARNEEYWPRITNAFALLTEAPLLIDDTPGISIEQFLARCRRAHKQNPLKLAILDHMHTMALDPRAEQRNEYGRIVRGAKKLAHELNIPVVLMGQLSRKNTDRKDKRPQMSDLRESGEIEQEADVILFLHREDYYDANTHMAGIVELIVAKGRDIETGKTIYLQNRFDQMRLDPYDGMPPEPPAPAASSGWGGKKTRSSN